MSSSNPLDRRSFIKSTVLAGAAAGLIGHIESSAEAREHSRTVMDLRTPPMERVRVAFVGLGMRGSGAIGRYLALDGVEIAALCDIRPNQVAAAQKQLAAKNRPAAKEFGKTADDW